MPGGNIARGVPVSKPGIIRWFRELLIRKVDAGTSDPSVHVEPAAVPSEDPPETPSIKNQHVAEAIRAYCNFRYPQRFALMVNGKWGSGKTHLIREVANSLIDRRLHSDRNRPLYITLYGVKSQDEIAEQMYQQMHPFLANKGVRFVGALLKGALKTTIKVDLDAAHTEDLSLATQIPDVNALDLLGNPVQRVVIFDDFERAAMKPVELLGYINPLIEHDGCKVIILVNEEIIHKDEEDKDYNERKEKTVGQTLYVAADIDGALDSSLQEIDTMDLAEFYVRRRGEIRDLFNDSRLDNLRLLKQFLWDFERFWLVLTEDHRKHCRAMLEIMLLMAAWTLEIRSRRIDASISMLTRPPLIWLSTVTIPRRVIVHSPI